MYLTQTALEISHHSIPAFSGQQLTEAEAIGSSLGGGRADAEPVESVAEDLGALCEETIERPRFDQDCLHPDLVPKVSAIGGFEVVPKSYCLRAV